MQIASSCLIYFPIKQKFKILLENFGIKVTLCNIQFYIFQNNTSVTKTET